MTFKIVLPNAIIISIMKKLNIINIETEYTLYHFLNMFGSCDFVYQLNTEREGKAIGIKVEFNSEKELLNFFKMSLWPNHYCLVTKNNAAFDILKGCEYETLAGSGFFVFALKDKDEALIGKLKLQ